MNRSYIAGCLVIVAAAGFGYWIFSDKLQPHRPPPPSLPPAMETGDNISEAPVIYSARTTGDVIDLGRAYDPTGEELDLHNLLHGRPVAELAPLPRETEAELGPKPREDDRELLHTPRLIVADFREAGEEASSPPSLRSVVGEPFSWIVAGLFADWLNRSLPLKGSLLMPGASNH